MQRPAELLLPTGRRTAQCLWQQTHNVGKHTAARAERFKRKPLQLIQQQQLRHRNFNWQLLKGAPLIARERRAAPAAPSPQHRSDSSTQPHGQQWLLAVMAARPHVDSWLPSSARPKPQKNHLPKALQEDGLRTAVVGAAQGEQHVCTPALGMQSRRAPLRAQGKAHRPAAMRGAQPCRALLRLLVPTCTGLCSQLQHSWTTAQRVTTGTHCTHSNSPATTEGKPQPCSRTSPMSPLTPCPPPTPPVVLLVSLSP